MEIKKKIVERVKIISPMTEREDVLDYVYKNGYSMISQGPLINGSIRAADLNKFCYIGEKEIKVEY
jgi:hypothetical protein